LGLLVIEYDRRLVFVENIFDELFFLKMNQYDDAEEALTEANFLNNQNAGKKLIIRNKELDFFDLQKFGLI